MNTVLLFNEWTLQRGAMLFISLTSTVISIFHSIILVYKLSPLDWKTFKNHLDGENYDLESNDSRNVLSRCRLKLLDFSHTMYKIVPYVKDFVPFKFLLNFYLKTLASSYRKMYREMTRVKKTAGRVSLARHFSQTSTMTYLFYCIF